jgi:hypothetical protein
LRWIIKNTRNNNKNLKATVIELFFILHSKFLILNWIKALWKFSSGGTIM